MFRGSGQSSYVPVALLQGLNGARTAWEARNGTTTVMRVQNINSGEIQTWVATETPTMPTSLEGALRQGEVFVEGPGHAEQTIVNALDGEWRIIGGGTSRNVCIPICQPLLEGQGLQLGGPIFRGMPDKTPYRMFWRPE